MRIRDMIVPITYFNPVCVIVDGETVWDDEGIDLTNHPSTEEVKRRRDKSYDDYYRALSSDASIACISFNIVEDHHSVVYITTEQEGAQDGE